MCMPTPCSPPSRQEVADLPGHARQQQLDLRGSGAESAAVNRAQLGQLGPLLSDPALRLAAMDAAGVDLQVISPMPLYHYWADTAGRGSGRPGSPTRASPNWSQLHPDRFAGLGTVPLQHPDLAIDRIDPCGD